MESNPPFPFIPSRLVLWPTFSKRILKHQNQAQGEENTFRDKVIKKIYFRYPKWKKRFVAEEEKNLLVYEAVRESTKKSTSYAVNNFRAKLFTNISSNF